MGLSSVSEPHCPTYQYVIHQYKPSGYTYLWQHAAKAWSVVIRTADDVSTDDVTLTPKLLHNLTYEKTYISLADGNTVVSYAHGYIRYKNHFLKCILLDNRDGHNLISVAQLSDKNFITIFAGRYTYILEPEHTQYQIVYDLLQRLFHPQNSPSLGSAQAYSLAMAENIPPTTTKTEAFKLHEQYGHTSSKKLRQLGFTLTPQDIRDMQYCSTCHSSKPKRGSHRHTAPMLSNKPFERLHMDSSGPYIHCNAKYWIVYILDDYSRFLKTFVAPNKHSIAEEINKYITKEQNRLGYYPSYIRKDLGTEFAKLDLHDIIEVQNAPVADKEYNGKAERIVQTISRLIKACTTHLDSRARSAFFTYSVSHATTLYNGLPHSSINSTPVARFYHSAYKLPPLPVFLEDATLYSNGPKPLTFGFFVSFDYHTHLYTFVEQHSGKLISIKRQDYKTLGTFHMHVRFTNDNWSMYNFEHIRDAIHVSPLPALREFLPMTHVVNTSLMQNRSISTHCRGDTTSANSDGEKTTAIQRFIPRNYKEASKHSIWRAAQDKEIDQFIVQNVFTPYTSNSMAGATILSSFWIYTWKAATDSAKARVVIIDSKQVGKKQPNVTSPVVKLTTVALLLAKASISPHLELCSFDIKNAFLNTPVPSNLNLILKTPAGFDKHYNSRYVRLQKYSYGLNAAPQAFYEHFQSQMKPLYPQQRSDLCLNVSESDGLFVHYVDDILGLVPDKAKLAKDLSQHFQITTTPTVKQYIGYDFNITDECIELSNATYLESVFANFTPQQLEYIQKGSKNPFTSAGNHLAFPPEKDAKLLTEDYILQLQEPHKKKYHSPLLHTNLPPYENTKTFYRHLTGTLQYVTTRSRPDIRFYANVPSRYNEYPNTLAFQEAFQLFRFLYHTQHYKLTYPKVSAPPDTYVISIYSDASYHDSDSGYAGYFIFFNNQYLTSHSSRITTITTSSYYSELIALSDAVEAAMSMLDNIKSIFGDQPVTIEAFCDNKPLVPSLKFKSQKNIPQKYVNRFYELRQYILEGQMTLTHIYGQLNPADILTKRLGGLELLRHFQTEPLNVTFRTERNSHDDAKPP